jgi:hypothetical protein
MTKVQTDLETVLFSSSVTLTEPKISISMSFDFEHMTQEKHRAHYIRYLLLFYIWHLSIYRDIIKETIQG